MGDDPIQSQVRAAEVPFCVFCRAKSISGATTEIGTFAVDA
jgi:hypothetical protein